MSKDATDSSAHAASTAEIRAALGALNESDLLEIAALRPNIREVEEAAVWLSGDRDVFGEATPLKGVAAEIVGVLTRGEDEEEPRSR
jgi:hypothetical protein